VGQAGKLQIISINIDEDRQIFKKIVKAFDETSLIWISDANKRTARKYGVEGIPHMVIINAEGKVAAVHIGYGEAQLPTLIDEINAIARTKPAES
jgi:thioredoxin-related protein